MIKNYLRATLLMTLLTAPISLGAQCIKPDSLNVSWSAFKTLKKIGVKGNFTKVEVGSSAGPKKQSRPISELSLTIDPEKLTTQNKTRDKNIVDYFFSGVGKIDLRVQKVSKKWIMAQLKMNGIKKTIPFSYQISKNSIKAQAHIDILDFGMSKQLLRINKECFSMHEGKTWSHVETRVEALLVDCER